LGLTAGKVGLFFGIVFLIGGGILTVAGHIAGGIIVGVFALIIIYASHHHIKKTGEKIHAQLLAAQDLAEAKERYIANQQQEDVDSKIARLQNEIDSLKKQQEPK